MTRIYVLCGRHENFWFEEPPEIDHKLSNYTASSNVGKLWIFDLIDKFTVIIAYYFNIYRTRQGEVL